MLREHASEAEVARRVSPAVNEALREAGLYRLWRPRSLGGFELDPVSGFRILEEISRADSAAGWNASLANNTEIFGAWFKDSVASQVFGDDETVLAGAFNPPRQAISVDGGDRFGEPGTGNKELWDQDDRLAVDNGAEDVAPVAPGDQVATPPAAAP